MYETVEKKLPTTLFLKYDSAVPSYPENIVSLPLKCQFQMYLSIHIYI